MNSKDRPAVPSNWVNDGDRNATAPDGQVVPPGAIVPVAGMSLRAYIATHALQGFVSNYGTNITDHQAAAQFCTIAADALLAELAK